VGVVIQDVMSLVVENPEEQWACCAVPPRHAPSCTFVQAKQRPEVRTEPGLQVVRAVIQAVA
jgi:hypothetical protein